ncbi:hypothetical protein P7C70_g3130, partial [Phenoliferia sp. Uapishka_3]
MPTQLASIPPEIIDHILDELLKTYDTALHHTCAAGHYKLGRVEDLKSIALIGRQWRGPAQRRLFEKLVVRDRAAAWRWTGEGTGDLRELVKDLVVVFRPCDGSREPDSIGLPPTEADFVGLLERLPNVASLALHRPTFPSFHPTYLANIQRSLRRITSMELHIERATAVLPQLLSRTPHLLTLSIGDNAEDSVLAPLPIDNPLVKLGNLTTFEVTGGTWPHQLASLHLLDPSSFANVTHLHYLEDRRDSFPVSSTTALFKLVGPSLYNLRWGSDFNDVSIALAHCPRLETLHIAFCNANGFSDVNFVGACPPTTHSIEFDSSEDALRSLKDAEADQKWPAGLKGVKVSSMKRWNKAMKLDVEGKEVDRWK